MSLQNLRILYRFFSFLVFTLFLAVLMLSFPSHSDKSIHLQKRSQYLEVRQGRNNTGDGASSSSSSSTLKQDDNSRTISGTTVSIESGSTSTSSPFTPSSPSSNTSSTTSTSSISSSDSFLTVSSIFSSSLVNSSSPSPSRTSSAESSSTVTSTVTSTSSESTSSTRSNRSSSSSDSAAKVLATQDPTSSFEPTPTTTLVLTQTTTPSPISSVSTSSPSNTAVAETSKSGFWSNKPAVAGMITAIVVVVIAALVALCFLIKKRKNSRRYDDFANPEKFLEPSLSESRPTSEPSSHSHEELMGAPMDTHVNHDPVYYPRDPFANVPYATGSLPEITYSYAQDVNNQYPYYPDEDHTLPPSGTGPKLLTQTPTVSASTSRTNLNPFADTAAARTMHGSSSQTNLNPFADPAASGRTHHATSSSPQPPSRASTYQPSIDSFYGATGDMP